MSNLNILIVILEEDTRFKNDEIKNVVERYLKQVIGERNFNVDVTLWKDFFNFFKNNSKNNFNDKNAILFLTYEDLPFGEFPESWWNKSRTIREFIKNSMCSVSASYNNILIKLKELIVNFYSDSEQKNNLSEAKKILKELGKNLPKQIELEDILQAYTYSSIGHHPTLHSSTPQSSQEIYHDLAMCIAFNTKNVKDVRILVIDDDPENIEENLSNIKKLMGNECEIYLTYGNSWKNFLDEEFWKNYLYSKKEDKIKNIREINNHSKYAKFWENEKFFFTHIVIDLLYENFNRGNEIIRNFVKFRATVNRGKMGEQRPAFFDIIVLSGSSEIEDIKRSLEEGGIIYIFKNRIYQLPAYIALFEKSREVLHKISGTPLLGKARNFQKLYRLPESVIRKLKIEPFLNLKCSNENIEKIAEDVAYEFIKKLPKADLHIHLGGAMDDELVFNLSLLSVFNIFRENKEKLKEIVVNILEEDFFNFLEKDAILPVLILEAWKIAFLYVSKNIFSEYVFKNIKIYSLCEFLYEEVSPSPYECINKIKEYTPEEIFFKYIFFRIKKELKEKIENFGEDELVCIFNVLIGIYEGRTEKEIEKFWKNFENIFNISEEDNYFKKIKEEFEKEIKSIYLNLSNSIFSFYSSLKNNIKLKNSIKIPYLRSLLNSFSRREIFEDEKFEKVLEIAKKILNVSNANQLEELKKDYKILFSQDLKMYLRPAKFTGSALLKGKLNIYVAIYWIADWLLKNKVRYVEIRCHPLGYTHKKFSLKEAVETLLRAADLVSIYKYITSGEFIQINYIISGKKHKSPEKISQEISNVIVNRQREFIEFPSNIKNKMYPLYPSRIVGFDLAGYEKGTDLEDFEKDLLPLFRTCSFITIHAGEEFGGEYIWKAIYNLHAHRIGHGLRIKEIPFLLSLIRDLKIGIELCPISNIFTNPNLKNSYPLFEYLKEGIQCIISTDDPIFSNSDISKEYVMAAKLYYYASGKKEELTKWELLRLIKNSFKFAFLEKDKIDELLRAIEEEIYEIIIKEYGFN
jgi:adenosine deaminase